MVSAEPSLTRSLDAQSGRHRAGWVLALLAAVLIFAPLVRAGNRPLPLLVLEIAALLLFAWLLARPQPWSRMPPLLWVALGGLVLLPLAQMVPLPAGWVSAGREGFAVALGGLGIEHGNTAISVVPFLTESAALALLPPLAVFLLVVNLQAGDVQRLVLVFLAMACLQAVLGLMQFGSGGKALAEFGIGFGSGSGEGTYTNRNHLAGLLEMALPVALALLAASVFRLDRSASRRRRPSWWARIKHLGAAEGDTNRSFLYAALCLVLLLGLVFTRSRTGIAMGMLGLLMMTVLLVRNFGGRLSGHLIGVIGGAGLLLATTVGLAPILARFSADPMGDGRWAIFDASWQAIKDFFPFGSGAGTYVEVIHAYHPDDFTGEAYINHAHNDYLEWLVEGGVPALVVMLLFAAAYLARWPAVWRVRNWQTLHMMQVGAGVGLFVLMVHGLTDYNLRIPANQIYFALLAAVFFHPGHGGHAGRVSPGAGARRDVPPERAANEDVRPARAARNYAVPTAVPTDEAAVAAWASAPPVADRPDAAPESDSARADRGGPAAGKDNPFADNPFA